MATKEELLANNVREYFSEGNSALKRKSNNAAVSLFFKTLAVLADWVILQREGLIPKSHTDRFRILEEKYPEIYEILDKDFPSYQDSYSISMTKETAEAIKNDVQKIAEKAGFKLD